jgi:uncharacterized cupin superfamily protein
MKPYINVADVVLEHHQHGDRFEAQDGSVSDAIGSRLLGCSLCVVPPGKRAWPLHNHHVNEELFVILAGHGVRRVGDTEHPVRAGDVIAAPPGGKDTAHQIINTSDGELRYLAISTRLPYEIVEYPDSGKVLVRAGAAEVPGFRHRGDLGAARDYWDGE